jgi:hypothetical protein
LLGGAIDALHLVVKLGGMCMLGTADVVEARMKSWMVEARAFCDRRFLRLGNLCNIDFRINQESLAGVFQCPQVLHHEDSGVDVWSATLWREWTITLG